MAIVTLSEALLQRLSAPTRRILRGKALCGFCLKVNKRSLSFLVATSVQGRQLRMTLGRWPLISVEEARTLAKVVLRDCRSGLVPSRRRKASMPTVKDAILAYGIAKRLKPGSKKRYDSIFRTHFGDWLDRPVSALADPGFAEDCHKFGQTKGAALVEVGRGVVGSLFKYLNAVHGLNLVSPFGRLAAAGLLPERSKPRARLLRDEGINLTCGAIDFEGGVVSIPDTKNGKPHSLPITPMMEVILRRRCMGLAEADRLFTGVSKEHLYAMAQRLGAPRFMLHDLRKLVATTGERLKVGDAVLRRILNHTAPTSDVLHAHYVSLDPADVLAPLVLIQGELSRLMGR